jgi:hypothetical protein
MTESKHLQDTGIDGRKIMKGPSIGWKCVNWIHLAQDRENWWALMNTAMNH